MVADPSCSALCVREFQNSLGNSVKRTIELCIESLGVGHLFDVQRSTILRRGGSGIITFVGMRDHTADTIKSYANYDIAFVEEAQALSQLSLDLLRPTVRKPGSELWFAWNPRSAVDAVDRFLRVEKPDGAIVVEVNWWGNRWFPDELKQEMEHDRKRNRDRYLHVWCGQYEQLSSRKVFKNWRIEEFEAPSSAHLRFGIDFGFAVDPTVGVRCYLDGRTLYVDHEVFAVGVETVDLPDFLLQLPDVEKWPSIADSSRPEHISHLRNNGLRKVQSSVKGAGSVDEGIAFLQGFDLVIHPRCHNTIREIGGYCYKVDESGKVLPKLQDKDNHVIDALRYACEGARRLSNHAARGPYIPPPTISHRW
jgi:phage terminase large subunit